MAKRCNNNYMWFDWAVMDILRNKDNFDILEGFIKVMTGKEMTISEVLDSEEPQLRSGSKLNSINIKATDEEGDNVIIEMQNIREFELVERIRFGITNVVAQQCNRGNPCSKNKKVYSINIIYYNFGEGYDYLYQGFLYHGQTELYGIHTHNKLLLNAKEKMVADNLLSNDVSPKYFIIRVDTFNPTTLSPHYMEQWMDYLKTGTIRPEYDAPGLAKAREALSFDNMSSCEKKNYRNYIDTVRTLHYAIKANWAEGFAEGLAKSRSLGVNINIDETAKHLLRLGKDIKAISWATGLTEDKISLLQEN